MKLILFDVDGTLEISEGPVFMADVFALYEKHVVGLCGNWALAVNHPDLDPRVWTFINAGAAKDEFMKQIKLYTQFDDYIMVGDMKTDEDAARSAGFRFIWAREFRLAEIL